jgi:YD repeat-containing protein
VTGKDPSIDEWELRIPRTTYLIDHLHLQPSLADRQPDADERSLRLGRADRSHAQLLVERAQPVHRRQQRDLRLRRQRQPCQRDRGARRQRLSDDYAYTYDIENRLVVAVWTSRSASGTRAVTSTLRYDPLGQLYEVSDTQTGATRFLYDGDDLVAEGEFWGHDTKFRMNPSLWGSAGECVHATDMNYGPGSPSRHLDSSTHRLHSALTRALIRSPIPLQPGGGARHARS